MTNLPTRSVYVVPKSLSPSWNFERIDFQNSLVETIILNPSEPKQHGRHFTVSSIFATTEGLVSLELFRPDLGDIFPHLFSLHSVVSTVPPLHSRESHDARPEPHLVLSEPEPTTTSWGPVNLIPRGASPSPGSSETPRGRGTSLLFPTKYQSSRGISPQTSDGHSLSDVPNC